MKILIYEQGFEDFSTMGLGEVRPASCIVHEEQGGAYELDMDHPMDESGRWDLLRNGRVLRVPVPAKTTPHIQMQALASREVWKCTTEAEVYSMPTTEMGQTVTIPDPPNPRPNPSPNPVPPPTLTPTRPGPMVNIGGGWTPIKQDVIY